MVFVMVCSSLQSLESVPRDSRSDFSRTKSGFNRDRKESILVGSMSLGELVEKVSLVG